MENAKKKDKLIKLNEVEEILRKVIAPVPSRPTLISYIESGKLLGMKSRVNRHYYVYQSSLEEFVKLIQTK